LKYLEENSCQNDNRFRLKTTIIITYPIINREYWVIDSTDLLQASVSRRKGRIRPNVISFGGSSVVIYLTSTLNA
jgi:hypothetical protein